MPTDRRAERTHRGQALLAEAISLSRRAQQLEHDLERLDSALSAVQESRSSEVVIHKIEAGLGTVRVDGHGRLLDITLDTGAVSRSNPDIFGERILTALHAAEKEAHNAYLERIAEAHLSSGISDYSTGEPDLSVSPVATRPNRRVHEYD